MSSSTLLERGSSAVAPFCGPSQSYQPGTIPQGSPAAANWCVLPRCSVEFEKTSTGCKIWCRCEDEVARGTLQNLCKMLCDGLCSCCCTYNGITCCQVNFTCCSCKCEFTKDGCCISCCSGDKECCQMVQKCCECLQQCCESGCCCYICFNNTPVCCGTCA